MASRTCGLLTERVLLLFGLVNLFLAAPGFCRQGTAGRGDESVQRTLLPGTDLRVAIRKLEGRKLSVSYALRNGSKGPILVFNRLYASDSMGNILMEPKRFYIFQESPGVLELTKRVMPIPPGRAVESPEVPLGVLLKPGCELKETETLSLPLRMDVPYGEAKDLRKKVFKKINFSLGMVPMSEDLPIRRGNVGGEEVLILPYGPALKNQILMMAEPVSCEVEALVR